MQNLTCTYSESFIIIISEHSAWEPALIGHVTMSRVTWTTWETSLGKTNACAEKAEDLEGNEGKWIRKVELRGEKHPQNSNETSQKLGKKTNKKQQLTNRKQHTVHALTINLASDGLQTLYIHTRTQNLEIVVVVNSFNLS